jgi:hypothetical protein
MSVAEQIFQKAQVLPEPVQKVVLDLVEKLVKQNVSNSTNGGQREPSRTPVPAQNDKVRLPLIDSKEPGVLNLTNADIEELLA